MMWIFNQLKISEMYLGQMVIRYTEHFSHLDKDYNLEKHIIGLLSLGYTADELSDLLKISDDVIVSAINDFAREQMNKIKYNGLMEKLGYEYKREETENIFG
jgi:hypothetical protein